MRPILNKTFETRQTPFTGLLRSSQNLPFMRHRAVASAQASRFNLQPVGTNELPRLFHTMSPVFRVHWVLAEAMKTRSCTLSKEGCGVLHDCTVSDFNPFETSVEGGASVSGLRKESSNET